MDKLTGLKDAPLWFLSAAVIIALGLWQVPALCALVPADYQKYLPLAALAFGFLTAAQGINRVVANRAAQTAVRRDQERLKLQKVIRPMVTLFATRHVTASSAVLAPRLIDRINEARHIWVERRNFYSRCKGAIKALGDRKELRSAEMEYGGAFPIDRILAIAEANTDYVDSTLHGFIRRADRSRYEDDPDHGPLTDEEYELFEHLWKEEKRLVKRTGH